jgi:hypothetical protein
MPETTLQSPFSFFGPDEIGLCQFPRISRIFLQAGSGRLHTEWSGSACTEAE